MDGLVGILVAFSVVALLAAMVPGVDTALVTKNSVSRGTKAALLTALGCSTGQLFWGVTSALGVAAILATSATAFSVVKFLGAVYLVYLGVRSIVAALAGGDRENETETRDEPEFLLPKGYSRTCLIQRLRSSSRRWSRSSSRSGIRTGFSRFSP